MTHNRTEIEFIGLKSNQKLALLTMEYKFKAILLSQDFIEEYYILKS